MAPAGANVDGLDIRLKVKLMAEALFPWLHKQPTLQQRLVEAGGHPRGFDYLRLILTFSVITWHGIKATMGPAAERDYLSGPLHGAVCLLLPMFFALSGFLVCGSAERSRRVTTFLVHRLLRIMPALTVVALLSALVLGPLMTQMKLSSYFSSSASYAYLLNIFFLPQFVLPGVFVSTPEPFTVNASLWTIPYEVACYIGLTLLALSSLFKRPVAMILATLLFSLLFGAQILYRGSAANLSHFVTPGRFLLLCFIAGVVVYKQRDRLPSSIPFTILAGLLSYGFLSEPELYFLAPFPVAYFTACLGATRPPKIPVLMDGDLSYGLYLCAFPIQQTIATLSPAFRTFGSNVAASIILSLCYAYLSWHVIEKPALDRRKSVAANVENLIGAATRKWRGRPQSGDAHYTMAPSAGGLAASSTAPSNSGAES